MLICPCHHTQLSATEVTQTANTRLLFCTNKAGCAKDGAKVEEAPEVVWKVAYEQVNKQLL